MADVKIQRCEMHGVETSNPPVANMALRLRELRLHQDLTLQQLGEASWPFVGVNPQD